MKKLESIRGSRFELNNDQMNSLTGGEYSYCYFSTEIGSSNETKTDLKAWDVCLPMP